VRPLDLLPGIVLGATFWIVVLELIVRALDSQASSVWG